MSNVVDFLEKMGQDAHLRYATTEELAQALTHAGVEPALQAALLQRDARQLETLLSVPPNVCCIIQAPMDEEPDSEEPEQDEQISSGRSLRGAHDRRVAL